MVCDIFNVLLDSEQDGLLKDISKLAFDFFSRTENLVALQIDANVSMTTRYLPIRRFELSTFRLQEFYEILKRQRECFLFSFTDSEIIQIEDEFSALKIACTISTSPSEDDGKSFDDSRKPYSDRYSKLRRFLGGMATVF